MNTAKSPGAKPGKIDTFVSSGAITKFAVVVLSTSVTGTVALPAAANAEPQGIAMYAVATAKELAVVESGTYWAVAAAAITRSAWCIIADTSGRLKVDPKTTTTTSNRVGKALTPAATAGDWFILDIRPQTVYNV